MKIKFGDIIIICFIVLCAVFLITFDFSSGDTVIVEVDGKQIKQLSLNKSEEFVYEGEYTNVIKVSDGTVCIEKSDCPDKTCVHTGKTKSSKKVICCLPNKLVVRVVKDDKTGTDVVSG